ncbi:MAG: serpin family protein [Cystobacterineae bacterium]|nr:serpin family protein [Cystobacterineae bacterium]
MSGILPNKTEGKAADTLFIENSADFFVQLFKNTINLKDKKNALISPVSVWLALSMTANGADNNTLSEMEKVLGGSIPISELNRYIYTYVNGLPSEEKSKLHIANSIWFKEGFQVNNNFLQVNADYFGAKAYQSAFDDMTLKDINLWVKLNTYGMIDEILDEIPREAILYLINAVAFDAEWKNIYNKTAVGKGEFNNMDGEKQTVDFMASEEGVYVEDNQATGFIKPYVNDTYSFVALLPKEGVSIESYIASLSGAGFMDTLKNAQQETVTVRLPKFSYHYGITMNDALEALGMPEAFDGEKADFSKMTALSMKNLYISKVLHKAFIEVNERGTKAGAATAVEIRPASMPPPPKKEVILERPFVYAIVDNTTKLPIFMGVVLTLE